MRVALSRSASALAGLSSSSRAVASAAPSLLRPACSSAWRPGGVPPYASDYAVSRGFASDSHRSSSQSSKPKPPAVADDSKASKGASHAGSNGSSGNSGSSSSKGGNSGKGGKEAPNDGERKSVSRESKSNNTNKSNEENKDGSSSGGSESSSGEHNPAVGVKGEAGDAVRAAMRDFRQKKWGAASAQAADDAEASGEQVNYSELHVQKLMQQTDRIGVVRQSTIKVQKDRMQELIDYYESKVRPVYTEPGLQGAYLLVSQTSSEASTITVWDDERCMKRQTSQPEYKEAMKGIADFVQQSAEPRLVMSDLVKIIHAIPQDSTKPAAASSSASASSSQLKESGGSANSKPKSAPAPRGRQPPPKVTKEEAERSGVDYSY